jgi:hypothetical protein
MKHPNVKGPLLALLLVLLLTHPLVRIADKVDRLIGVPVLYLYFFGVWLLLIVVIYRAHGRSRSGGHG